MNRVKFLEIRDRNTFVPMVAISCQLTGNSYNDYLLRRAGYGDVRCILLTRLDGYSSAHYDCYNWGDRTFKVAHNYIIDHWDDICDQDVIDVEFILGEKLERKRSERYTAEVA